MTERHHMSVRLSDELVARIEAQLPRFSTRWRTATTSDVLRGLIISGLDALEREQTTKAQPKRGKRGAR